MRTFFLLRVKSNCLKSLFKYKVSFVVCDKPNNSAFIINMVTVFYLFAFQVINPLKRRMVYPCKFFWLLVSFIKEVSVTIFNLSPSLNLNLNMQVLNK